MAVTPDVMAGLERLASLHGCDDGAPLFGALAGTISCFIAAAAKAAGLGSRFFGHWGRAAMAGRMTRNGAPAAGTSPQCRYCLLLPVNYR